MAVTDYGVKRPVHHNGVLCHVGRIVQLDSAAPATVAMLALGTIAAKSSETLYDSKAGDPVGVQNANALTTYTVQAAGSGKITHNGAVKTTGNTIQLDPLDDTAKRLVAIGWVA